VIFLAFGWLVRGIAGLPERETEQLPATNRKERKLLEAVREHGELTPAWAAMETSLSVAETGRMLGHPAEGGHPRTGARGVMGGVVSFFSQGWEGA
jgi:hypothetical protein